MAINTGDLFSQELGSDTYEDRRESQAGQQYDATARLLAQTMARKSRVAREVASQRAQEQADIDERAAEYSDFGGHADTATHNTMANRMGQGAMFGPWGAVGGAIFGAGESLVRGAQSGNLGTVANELLNPFEAVPGSIEAIGGALDGRNTSGIDDPRLGASRLQMAGNAAQQGLSGIDWAGDDGASGGDYQLGGGEQLSLDPEMEASASLFSEGQDVGPEWNAESPLQMPESEVGLEGEYDLTRPAMTTAWGTMKTPAGRPGRR